MEILILAAWINIHSMFITVYPAPPIHIQCIEHKIMKIKGETNAN